MCWQKEAGEDVEEGGLPGAIGSNNADNFPLFDVEGNPLKNGLGLEGEAYVFESEKWWHRCMLQSSPMLEKLFPFQYYRVNVHAHSTHSDGSCTPQEIDAIAQHSHLKNALIAITDHNNVRAHEELTSPRILPGVEVKVEEGGVDVLLYAEREKLIAFFHDVIEPALDSSDPIYGATHCKILELVGSAHEAGMEIVIPHYSHLEGLSVLPQSLQREVAKFPVAIELNTLLSRSANGVAKKFASSVHRPLIAAADSHRPDQYLAAYTSIPLRRDDPPTIQNLFRSLRAHPHFCRKHLQQVGLFTRLATGWNVLTSAGIFSILRQYFRSGGS